MQGGLVLADYLIIGGFLRDYSPLAPSSAMRYTRPMVRQPRIVIPGVTHHVTQRGNNRQDVFFVDDDCRMYLSYLKKSAALYSSEVSAFCLMANHIHLVTTSTPETHSPALRPPQRQQKFHPKHPPKEGRKVPEWRASALINGYCFQLTHKE